MPRITPLNQTVPLPPTHLGKKAGVSEYSLLSPLLKYRPVYEDHRYPSQFGTALIAPEGGDEQPYLVVNGNIVFTGEDNQFHMINPNNISVSTTDNTTIISEAVNGGFYTVPGLYKFVWGPNGRAFTGGTNNWQRQLLDSIGITIEDGEELEAGALLFEWSDSNGMAPEGLRGYDFNRSIAIARNSGLPAFSHIYTPIIGSILGRTRADVVTNIGRLCLTDSAVEPYHPPYIINERDGNFTVGGQIYNASLSPTNTRVYNMQDAVDLIERAVRFPYTGGSVRTKIISYYPGVILVRNNNSGGQPGAPTLVNFPEFPDLQVFDCGSEVVGYPEYYGGFYLPYLWTANSDDPNAGLVTTSTELLEDFQVPNIYHFSDNPRRLEILDPTLARVLNMPENTFTPASVGVKDNKVQCCAPLIWDANGPLPVPVLSYLPNPLYEITSDQCLQETAGVKSNLPLSGPFSISMLVYPVFFNEGVGNEADLRRIHGLVGFGDESRYNNILMDTTVPGQVTVTNDWGSELGQLSMVVPDDPVGIPAFEDGKTLTISATYDGAVHSLRYESMAGQSWVVTRVPELPYVIGSGDFCIGSAGPHYFRGYINDLNIYDRIVPTQVAIEERNSEVYKRERVQENIYDHGISNFGTIVFQLTPAEDMKYLRLGSQAIGGDWHKTLVSTTVNNAGSYVLTFHARKGPDWSVDAGAENRPQFELTTLDSSGTIVDRILGTFEATLGGSLTSNWQKLTAPALVLDSAQVASIFTMELRLRAGDGATGYVDIAHAQVWYNSTFAVMDEPYGSNNRFSSLDTDKGYQFETPAWKYSWLPLNDLNLYGVEDLNGDVISVEFDDGRLVQVDLNDKALQLRNVDDVVNTFDLSETRSIGIFLDGVNCYIRMGNQTISTVTHSAKMQKVVVHTGDIHRAHVHNLMTYDYVLNTGDFINIGNLRVYLPVTDRYSWTGVADRKYDLPTFVGPREIKSTFEDTNTSGWAAVGDTSDAVNQVIKRTSRFKIDPTSSPALPTYYSIANNDDRDGWPNGFGGSIDNEISSNRSWWEVGGTGFQSFFADTNGTSSGLINQGDRAVIDLGASAALRTYRLYHYGEAFMASWRIDGSPDGNIWYPIDQYTWGNSPSSLTVHSLEYGETPEQPAFTQRLGYNFRVSSTTVGSHLMLREEFGTSLPDSTEVRVYDVTANGVLLAKGNITSSSPQFPGRLGIKYVQVPAFTMTPGTLYQITFNATDINYTVYANELNGDPTSPFTIEDSIRSIDTGIRPLDQQNTVGGLNIEPNSMMTDGLPPKWTGMYPKFVNVSNSNFALFNGRYSGRFDVYPPYYNHDDNPGVSMLRTEGSWTIANGGTTITTSAASIYPPLVGWSDGAIIFHGLTGSLDFPSSAPPPISIDILNNDSRQPYIGSDPTSDGHIVPLPGQSGEWNGIVTRSGQQVYIENELLNGLQEKTAIGVVLNSKGAQHYTYGFYNGSKDNVGEDIIGLAMAQNTGSIVECYFNGLDDSKFYTVRMFGQHLNRPGDGSINFARFGVNGDKKDTGPDTATCSWYSVSPSQGIINFSLEYINPNATNQYASLGGIQLQEEAVSDHQDPLFRCTGKIVQEPLAESGWVLQIETAPYVNDVGQIAFIFNDLGESPDAVFDVGTDVPAGSDVTFRMNARTLSGTCRAAISLLSTENNVPIVQSIEYTLTTAWTHMATNISAALASGGVRAAVRMMDPSVILQLADTRIETGLSATFGEDFLYSHRHNVQVGYTIETPGAPVRFTGAVDYPAPSITPYRYYRIEALDGINASDDPVTVYRHGGCVLNVSSESAGQVQPDFGIATQIPMTPIWISTASQYWPSDVSFKQAIYQVESNLITALPGDLKDYFAEDNTRACSPFVLTNGEGGETSGFHTASGVNNGCGCPVSLKMTGANFFPTQYVFEVGALDGHPQWWEIYGRIDEGTWTLLDVRNEITILPYSTGQLFHYYLPYNSQLTEMDEILFSFKEAGVGGNINLKSIRVYISQASVWDRMPSYQIWDKDPASVTLNPANVTNHVVAPAYQRPPSQLIISSYVAWDEELNSEQPKKYKLQGSNDYSNWTTLTDGTMAAGVNDLDRDVTDDTPYRYYRMQLDAETGILGSIQLKSQYRHIRLPFDSFPSIPPTGPIWPPPSGGNAASSGTYPIIVSVDKRVKEGYVLCELVSWRIDAYTQERLRLQGIDYVYLHAEGIEAKNLSSLSGDTDEVDHCTILARLDVDEGEIPRSGGVRRWISSGAKLVNQLILRMRTRDGNEPLVDPSMEVAIVLS